MDSPQKIKPLTVGYIAGGCFAIGAMIMGVKGAHYIGMWGAFGTMIGFAIASLFVRPKKTLASDTDEVPKIKKQISDTQKLKGDNWYFQRSRDGKIGQLVFTVPASAVKETEFGMMILPADKFPVLAVNPWCNGFVKMSDKPIPYMLIRVDEFDEAIKKSDLTISFSFCKLSAGGIFLVNTRIENQDIYSLVKEKFHHIAPIGSPMTEWVVFMDDSNSYTRRLMQDLFSASSLNIIVANSQGMETTIMNNNGSITDCIGPKAHHERSVEFDTNVNKLLISELNALMSHHNSIPSALRNAGKADQELCQLLPLDKDPIMIRRD